MSGIGIQTFFVGDRRHYEHPLAFTPPVDRPFTGHAIGVTSVLDIYKKPGIYAWSAKAAAAYAVNFTDEWQAVPTKAGKIDQIKRAPARYMNEMADLGTQVHAACEDTARWAFMGGDRPEVADHLKPYVEHYIAFLKEMNAVPTMLERTTWHHTLGYAGTFDALFQMGGELCVVDTKSGQSGTWPEHALQQCAYINAEVIVNPDGTEEPMPEITKAYALWLRPHGWALKPMAVGERTWTAFQHMLGLVQWSQYEATVIHKPINAHPITSGKAPR